MRKISSKNARNLALSAKVPLGIVREPNQSSEWWSPSGGATLPKLVLGCKPNNHQYLFLIVHFFYFDSLWAVR
ncbi:MAG: hypothetical protein ACRCXB_14930 [Aeromonadaceae bacterium]